MCGCVCVCVCVPIGGRLEYVFMLLCSEEKHSEEKVQELEQAAFDSAEMELHAQKP